MKKIVALVLSLVMVLGLATTAFGVATAALYEWNETTTNNVTTGKWLDISANVGIATGDDLEDLEADDDKYITGYEIGNFFFVEVPEAAATYKLVYGAKTVYLTLADEDDYEFVNKAVALDVVGELDDAVCGDWYDTAYDEDYDYYVTYSKKGIPTNVYVAGTDTENVNILVGGKLVEVEEIGTAAQLGHNYKGFDVVDYQYTTVKCSECGKVAKLYASATAAGDKAQKVADGWVTFADMFTYGVSAPEASDKVESAETFDAGIAMYVGMSVMAAAGSAVVLKKKD